MKIVARHVLTLTLAMAIAMGLTATAHAQSANLGANGTIGLQAGGSHGAGVGLGTGLGTGAPTPGPAPGMGTVGRSTAIGGTGSLGSGPALNNMRANGTSLNMSPNPRAPNVTGKAFGSQ